VVSEAGVVRGEAQGTTTVRVQTGGVEGSAPVVVLPRPEIGLSRSDVEFRAVSGEGNPPDEEVEIVNGVKARSPTCPSRWKRKDDDAGWLSASLESSVAPTTLTISASVGSLQPGVYEGTVLVSSPDAHNSPQAVRVTLQVEEPPPIIRLVPSSISFSSVVRSHEPATQTVEVRNAGGGTLSGLSVSDRVRGRPHRMAERHAAVLDGPHRPRARGLGPGAR
jgi:hypothetical protein